MKIAYRGHSYCPASSHKLMKSDVIRTVTKTRLVEWWWLGCPPALPMNHEKWLPEKIKKINNGIIGWLETCSGNTISQTWNGFAKCTLLSNGPFHYKHVPPKAQCIPIYFFKFLLRQYRHQFETYFRNIYMSLEKNEQSKIFLLTLEIIDSP